MVHRGMPRRQKCPRRGLLCVRAGRERRSARSNSVGSFSCSREPIDDITHCSHPCNRVLLKACLLSISLKNYAVLDRLIKLYGTLARPEKDQPHESTPTTKLTSTPRPSLRPNASAAAKASTENTFAEDIARFGKNGDAFHHVYPI